MAPSLTVRQGCKAHSCWDKRVRLLDQRLSALPIGVSEAFILALAKHFFTAGFKLSASAEAELLHWTPTERQVAVAAGHMTSAERLWKNLA